MGLGSDYGKSIGTSGRGGWKLKHSHREKHYSPLLLSIHYGGLYFGCVFKYNHVVFHER